MAFTPEQIDFIKANKGKISQREIAKMLNSSQGSVSKFITGHKEYYNREVRRAYYKKNKKKCNARSKKSYLKHRDKRLAKLKDEYHKKKLITDERSWEKQIDEGIEIYHFVMRRYKLPRKVIYQRLRKDFEDKYRMKKAA